MSGLLLACAGAGFSGMFTVGLALFIAFVGVQIRQSVLNARTFTANLLRVVAGLCFFLAISMGLLGCSMVFMLKCGP